MIGRRSGIRAVLRHFALLVALLASAGCGVVPVGKSVDIPPGVTSRMSAEEVEAIVRDIVAANVASVGRELRALPSDAYHASPRERQIRGHERRRDVDRSVVQRTVALLGGRGRWRRSGPATRRARAIREAL